MATTKTWHSPRRITDLVKEKRMGCTVTCIPEFEMLPADFLHQNHPYRAILFLCRYTGRIDAREYSFRKCYARGCPHNHCAHVSRAVMIANRYLQRDFHRLNEAGIEVEEKIFTLEDMLVKFDDAQSGHDTIMTLEEYIQTLEPGDKVLLNINLECLPAVEHFANSKNRQTFLAAEFDITAADKTRCFQRCLSCFPTDREKEEKEMQAQVANARLKNIYQLFNQRSLNYPEIYFS